MEKLTKDLKKLKTLAIIFTLSFVVGVVTIIFATTSGELNTTALIIGCLFAGMGFYGTPITWVFYFNHKRVYVALGTAVLKQNISEIKKIETNTGLPHRLVIMGLQKMIRNGILGEYHFDGDYLLPIGLTINQVADASTINGGECKNCGANVKFAGASGVCPYCETVVYLKND